MSCYEWERGEIIIPRTAYPVFRTAVIAVYNEYLRSAFSKAEALYVEINTAHPRRDANQVLELENLMQHRRLDDNSNTYWLIWSWLKSPESNTRLRRPLKSQLADRLVRESSSATLRLGESSIALSNDTHSVVWDVPENNRACERAREHPVAIAFFKLLDKIEWKRGSGGEIAGNNEYNRESSAAGGGGNFVVASYGPKSKAKTTPRRRTRR